MPTNLPHTKACIQCLWKECDWNKDNVAKQNVISGMFPGGFFSFFCIRKDNIVLLFQHDLVSITSKISFPTMRLQYTSGILAALFLKHISVVRLLGLYPWLHLELLSLMCLSSRLSPSSFFRFCSKVTSLDIMSQIILYKIVIPNPHHSIYPLYCFIFLHNTYHMTWHILVFPLDFLLYKPHKGKHVKCSLYCLIPSADTQ